MALEQLNGAQNGSAEEYQPRIDSYVYYRLPSGKEISGPRATLLDAVVGTSADNPSSRGDLLAHQFGSDDLDFVIDLNRDIHRTRAVIRPDGFDIKSTVSRGRAAVEEPGYYFTAPSDGVLERKVDEYWPTGVRKQRGEWNDVMEAAKNGRRVPDIHTRNGHIPYQQDVYAARPVSSANGHSERPSNGEVRYKHNGVTFNDAVMAVSAILSERGLFDKAEIALPDGDFYDRLKKDEVRNRGLRRNDIPPEFQRFTGLVKMLLVSQEADFPNKYRHFGESFLEVASYLQGLQRDYRSTAIELLTRTQVKAEQHQKV